MIEVTNARGGMVLPLKVPSRRASKVRIAALAPSRAIFASPMMVCSYLRSGSDSICAAADLGRS